MATTLDLGLRWRWPALVLTTLAPTLACGRPGFTSLQFELVSVAYDGVDTLTLTFSEPIVDPAMVDPNDFRISAAQSYHYIYSYGGRDYSYQGTLYVDVGYGYAGGGRMSFASATLGAEDNTLTLKMAVPLGTYVCEVIAYYDSYFETYLQQYEPDSKFEMGLFMHYAAGEIPLESEAGDRLEDIGPQWVLGPNELMVVPRFGFVNLDPKIEIPCP